MGKRPPCCDKSNVKRGLWTPEEDAKILAYVSNHGIGNWTLVPKKAGLNRCGKSCRLRWTNYLRPDIKHDKFTPQEEDIIIQLHEAIGSRWSLIAKQLPGRTDNDVKNYWNTKLRKKLQKMGIDPLTHKPFSQVISDFGNISGISNTGSQMGSLNKSLNTTITSVLAGSSSSVTIMETMEQQVQDHSIVTCPTSWDFSSQFPLTTQPHFINNVSTSCSPSSSTSFVQFSPPQSYSCQQSQAPITPNSSSRWSEFLLNDPIFSTDFQHQEDHNFQEIMSPTNSSTVAQNDISSGKLTGGNDLWHFNQIGREDFGSYDYEVDDRPQANNNGDANSSSASSFIDGILDEDRKMHSQFPEFFDPAFDY